MSPVVNSTSWPSRKIVFRHLSLHHRQTQSHMALAICALCLALGGAVAFPGLSSAPARPVIASTTWSGKSVPARERGLAFRRGVSSNSETDGGPPVP
jgi:hypothetical protein